MIFEIPWTYLDTLSAIMYSQVSKCLSTDIFACFSRSFLLCLLEPYIVSNSSRRNFDICNPECSCLNNLQEDLFLVVTPLLFQRHFQRTCRFAYSYFSTIQKFILLKGLVSFYPFPR